MREGQIHSSTPALLDWRHADSGVQRYHTMAQELIIVNVGGWEWTEPKLWPTKISFLDGGPVVNKCRWWWWFIRRCQAFLSIDCWDGGSHGRTNIKRCQTLEGERNKMNDGAWCVWMRFGEAREIRDHGSLMRRSADSGLQRSYSEMTSKDTPSNDVSCRRRCHYYPRVCLFLLNQKKRQMRM
jgi:hypothetical protein